MTESMISDIGSAVKAIKTAILKSRYVAAKAANAEAHDEGPIAYVDTVEHELNLQVYEQSPATAFGI